MAITFINSTDLQLTAAASTWSIPTHSSMSGGATFVVALGLASSAVTISTVTDNTTNLYRIAIARPTPKPTGGAELWYSSPISSASTRVSVTLSANSSGSLGIAQFTGISTLNALNKTGSSAITANSTDHGASEITPSSANQVVVSYARLTASTVGTITNLGSMTSIFTFSSVMRHHGMYLVQGAASTATGSFTTSSNCQHASVIASFSDTQGVGPPRAMMMMGIG